MLRKTVETCPSAGAPTNDTNLQIYLEMCNLFCVAERCSFYMSVPEKRAEFELQAQTFWDV
jgi:hypothetical protein